MQAFFAFLQCFFETSFSLNFLLHKKQRFHAHGFMHSQNLCFLSVISHTREHSYYSGFSSAICSISGFTNRLPVF